ncbi:MAG: outer membrane beta-barrel protein [Thiohalomonadales bacterium]
MNNKIMYGIITALIIIIIVCFSRTLKADTINISYVKTSYDLQSPANIVFSDSSNGLSLTYGLELTPMLALEGSYKNLGSADRNVFFINTALETTMYSLALTANTSIGLLGGHDVHLLGSLGLIKADMDISAGTNSLSDSDTGMLMGVGINLDLSANDILTLRYTRTKLSFNNTINFDYDPSMFELGYSRSF